MSSFLRMAKLFYVVRETACCDIIFCDFSSNFWILFHLLVKQNLSVAVKILLCTKFLLTLLSSMVAVIGNCYRRDGIVIRASALQSVDLGFIP